MAQQEHFLEQHDPDRKDFQIDRIILFSDAVFAIAITLLIIEIKAPEAHHGFTVKEQLLQLTPLIQKFVGFIISFFVIAVYWRSHHRIFGFVNAYTDKLIWINVMFLFTIVLMPFSSAYFSENYGFSVPFVFYNINIVLTGLINYRLIRYIFNPENKLIKHPPTEMFIHLFRARAITIPIFFFCTMLPIPFGIVPNPMIYSLVWPVFVILRWYNARRYKNTSSAKIKIKA